MQSNLYVRIPDGVCIVLLRMAYPFFLRIEDQIVRMGEFQVLFEDVFPGLFRKAIAQKQRISNGEMEFWQFPDQSEELQTKTHLSE